MDQPERPPLVFANRVIRQYADHLVGDDVMILPNDYAVIRMVFRWCGGSWERLDHGDIVHNRLLAKILTTWGSKASRKKDVERV